VSNSLTNVSLLGVNPKMKALGIQCDIVQDKIKYNIVYKFDGKITQKIVLSNVTRFNDPICLLDPVILRAKLIMQLLW
jgi:hypothetical protein